MLIGFEFIWDETPLLVEIADILQKEENCDIVGITLGNRWKHLFKDKKFNLVSLSDFLEQKWDKFYVDRNILKNFEKKYGCNHDLWFFISVDRLLNDVNKHKFTKVNEKLKLLLLHFNFWERLFSKFNFNGFYTTGTAFMGLLTGMAVAQNLGVNFKGIYTTRHYKPRIVFVDNYIDEWKKAIKIYKNLQNVSNEELEKIEKEIYEVKEKSKKPIFMKNNWFHSSISKPYLKEFLKRLVFKYKYGWGNNRFDYVTPPLFERVLKELLVIVKRGILKNFYFPKKDLDFSKDFVFLPLQLQPEESCDIWGRYYSNQVAFVKNVADSLPLDLKLFVKEHSVAVGRRKGLFSYYNELKSLPNVELVNPYSNSHDYIKRAKIIILISGTAGWEGLIYEKPVITFGNVFYNNSGLVYNLKNFSQLKPTIRKIIEGENKFNKDKFLLFYYSLVQGSYEGYFNIPRDTNNLLDRKNIKNLAKAILNDANGK